ncbi:MAG TPA: hypothetical protein VHE13_18020 [Opitutus sp.]|nr:hypothetical protein [Opitutus sp.]
MKYLLVLVLSAAFASAYIPPPDQVVIDGRVVLTSSRPLQSFPWPKGHPRLSEYADEHVSDAREVEAIWEIKHRSLYLLAVSTFTFEPGAPLHSLGLHELMPERVKDGAVFADWFTGDLVLMEQERTDPSSTLLAQSRQAPRFIFRRLKIDRGRVVEEGPALTASAFNREK